MKNKSPAPAIPHRITLVSLAVDSIRAHLAAGQWRERLPPERELCGLLQISRHTLRAALADLERGCELSFQGRTRVSNLRSHPSKRPTTPRRVIFLIPEPLEHLEPTPLYMISKLRADLTRAGTDIKIVINAQAFSARSPRALEKITHREGPGLWVSLGSKEPMHRWFLSKNLPLLVIGSPTPEMPLPSMDVDHAAVCRHAAEVLWRAGHRRIALVGPTNAFGGDMESERAFQEAIEHRPAAKLTFLRHDGTTSHLRRMLDGSLAAKESPTAYFVMEARHALTLTTHLMRVGKRVPQDTAVLSRDDESYLARTSPAVSRYSISPALFARNLSRLIRQLAETGSLPVKATRLMPDFVKGETV